MNNSGLECNIVDVFEKYCNMTIKEMNQAVKRALRAGAKELVGVTKRNVRNGIKTHDNKHWYNGKIIVYNDKIEDAAMIGRVEGDFETELAQKVHIMGTGKAGSGTYRLRFLEKGTQDREAKTWKGKPLKKPRYLKRIEGQWYFKNAQQEVFPNLPSIYMREIEKATRKINESNINND